MGYTVFLTVAAHGIDLILHQGDERRYNNGCAFHDAGRQLVAQRLAPACGHQHKRVMLSKQVLDDRFLVAFKRLKTEVFLQCGC